MTDYIDFYKKNFLLLSILDYIRMKRSLLTRTVRDGSTDDTRRKAL